MSDTNDAASKTEEPTPRKLEQARQRGDVVKTMDLSAFASLAGAGAVVVMLGGWLSRNLAVQLAPFLSRPQEMALEGHGGVDIFRYALMAALPAFGAVMAAAAFSGVAANLLQTGFLFTPDKLKPDPGKLSPAQGFKRIFGPDGLIHFARSVLKVLATGAIGWWVLKPHWREITQLAALDPSGILPLTLDIVKRLVFSVAAFTLVVAGVDWLVQRQRFMARMRMSKEELKEDHKQSEGDPHVRARQKQIRNERARRRMMQAVPQATVVVMNPTHYAVALKYEQGEDAAPVCVAKGLDTLALKIREVAEAAGVPVIEDPPLARALYAAVDIDDMIPPAHYEAVAKIIGFILNGARRRAPA